MTDVKQALQDHDLIWILEQIPDYARQARLSYRTNDVCLFFSSRDGRTDQLRAQGATREQALEILQDTVPSCTNAIRLLSQPVPIGKVVVLIDHGQNLWGFHYELPADSLEVLN